MESIWEKTARSVSFDTPGGKKSTEVLIVGGGIAGILCAYRLREAGVDCLVAEATEILKGITKNTTAKITFCHGMLYHKLLRRFGEEGAELYLRAQIKACRQYEELCGKIDCDYEKRDSYVYSLDSADKAKREADALNRLGIDAELTKDTGLPFEVAGAVRVRNEAQFNPLKFLYKIAADLPILEHTKVRELMPGKAITDRGEISYKKLIIATHFPIINKHGGYFLKLYQHRSYVIALKKAPLVDGIFVDESDRGMSFRTYGDILLLGGGGHRTGKQGGCWAELENFAKKHYTGAEIVGKWATQDCMTLDDVPYIGQYSKSMPDVYVATGFNKWGMSNAMVAADLLCDAVQGKTSPYSAVFSPRRSILHPQLALNAIETTVGLLTPTAPRCPHLGCALKYNKAEHSWDCPCHGSRFDEDGQLIDNPATDDKRIK